MIGLNRALGIPAAAAVMVVLPTLVAAPSNPETPPAKEATLTVNLEGATGDADHPYDVPVIAEGAPPKGASTLRDASGLDTAEVVPGRNCQGQARVGFAGGHDLWCLRLERVASGNELTGVAVGGESDGTGERKLSLIVNRRDAFFGKPLLWMLAGFLVGLLALLFRAAMRSPIRRVVLGKLLRDNSRAATGARIVGLEAFVRDRLAAGEAIDDLIAKVDGLLANGSARAAGARESLEKVVEEKRGSLGDYAVWKSASSEAKRGDLKVEDFYGEDGTLRPPPSAQLEAALVQLDEDVRQIAGLRKATESLAEENRQTPEEALGRAEMVAKEASSPAECTRVGSLLADARDAVEKAQVREKRRRPGRRGKAPTRGAKETLAAPPPLNAVELAGSRLVLTRFTALAITAVAVAAVLALAIVTVKQAAFDPKLTFASDSDYVTLFLAALGSSAAGSVILLLGFWSPVPLSPED